jgi:TolA-binding protein
VWTTLPLIAAASCAVGLAAAGTGLYLWKAPETDAPLPAEATARQSQPPHVAVGGALLPIASAQDVPEERPAEPRAASPGSAGTLDDTRSLNVKQYATELRLLEPARSSLSRGDYSAALAALGQHRREFPDGQLRQEREALRVRALWGLGQKPAAIAAASAFRKRYPRSPLLSWLKDQGTGAP